MATRNEAAAQKVEAASARIGLGPFQRLAVAGEVARMAKQGMSEDEIAAALKKKKNVAGFDFSKIDFTTILQLVQLIMKLFGIG